MQMVTDMLMFLERPTVKQSVSESEKLFHYAFFVENERNRIVWSILFKARNSVCRVCVLRL